MTVDDALNSRVIACPFQLLHCCPVTEWAAAGPA